MSETELERLARREAALITRREAVKRVTVLLGGLTLVGGSALITGCRDQPAGDGKTTEASGAEFSAEQIAFLDEVADTILPTTSTPGAKAAQTGAFMALMVRDTYDERDAEIFRNGLRQIDEASQKMHDVGFMQATPQQRLALLQQLDREQHQYMRDREAAQSRNPNAPATEQGNRADAHLPDQRSEGGTKQGETNPAPAITADAPPHYFRMMKELALLGYFTSEIGYTQHMRYVEAPGRFDPCAPYTPGEKMWAPHA
jgi:hypothetical protein